MTINDIVMVFVCAALSCLSTLLWIDMFGGFCK